MRFSVLALFALALAAAPGRADSVGDIRPVIKSNGYPVETHSIVAKDGFTLNMVRIPYGRDGPGTGPRPVVFLQHGLEDSCATWLIGTPDEALGYIFADAGFDVWLGNVRGTTYSPPRGGSWAWSWDEMAEFDLPAMLAESLRVSGRETLTYIGHSQGTMMMFAKGTDPEVARMVSLFIALAPVAWLRDTTAPLVHGISKFPKLDWLISLLGLQEFDVRAVPHVACSYLPFLCDVTICAMAGCEGGMTTEMTELLADHFPDLTSWQNLEHYQQAVLSNTFRRFDYGTPTLNQKAYGSPTPPSYTFDNWNVSSSLFFGGRDTLADPTDVAKLIPKLPANRTEVTYLPNYGHGSFVWNQRAHVEIYPTIVEKAIAASPDGKYAVRRARPASRKMLGPVVFGGERLVPGGATGAEQ